MHFLSSLLIGASIAGIVYLIRYTLWENKTPSIISNLRWVIAIIIGLLVIFIEAASNWNIREISSVNAFLVYVIAQSLRNKSE